MGAKDAEVDQYIEVDRVFSVDEVAQYARLVGDGNPLHREWSKTGDLPDLIKNHPMVHWEKESTKVLVHGMLASSLFSCLFGRHIPGAVYLQQSLDFRRPVYAKEVVTARVIVTRIRKRKGRILTCNTVVTKDKEECIRGHADVWLPESDTLQES